MALLVNFRWSVNISLSASILEEQDGAVVDVFRLASGPSSILNAHFPLGSISQDLISVHDQVMSVFGPHPGPTM